MDQHRKNYLSYSLTSSDVETADDRDFLGDERRESKGCSHSDDISSEEVTESDGGEGLDGLERVESFREDSVLDEGSDSVGKENCKEFLDWVGNCVGEIIVVSNV